MLETIDSFTGTYGMLSNFWPCEVWIFGLKFPTVENAYQASKCADPTQRFQFQNMTPGTSKRIGRTLEIRDEWDSVKLDIMTDLLNQKFTKEPFRTFLSETGNATLIEGNTWGDTFWGVCNGRGENRLGTILMNIRENL